MKRLAWLVEGAAVNDVLVFTYSSHGTWTVERHGDERPADELDGRDEVLVTYDYRKDGGLVDDELSVMLGNRRLAPAVQGAAADTEVVAPGISCRQQIEHLTGRRAKHPAEVLRDALEST